jgi:hypothetical protein
MKLIDFVKKQATDAGIPADSPELLALINNPALADIDIVPGMANIIFSNLMTEESAKANPKVKAAIMANALNPLDTKIDELAVKYGVVDKWKEYREIHVRKTGDGRYNTYDSVEKFNEFIAAEEKTKASTGISSDKQKLIKDIEDLNSQMVNVKTTYEKKIQDLSESHNQAKIDWNLSSIFNAHTYALEEVQKMPKSAAAKVARDFVMSDLSQKGLKISQDENGNLLLLNAENAPYFEQNQKLSVQDYATKVLTENNFLKVSEKTEQRKTGMQDVDRTKLNAGQSTVLNRLDSLIQEAEKN